MPFHFHFFFFYGMESALIVRSDKKNNMTDGRLTEWKKMAGMSLNKLVNWSSKIRTHNTPWLIPR